MIKSTLFRVCLLLMGSLFFVTAADAQVSSKKKKEKAEKEVSEKENDKEDTDEEVDYYWSYTVLEVTGKPGNIQIKADKHAVSGTLKSNEMAIANKAAAGGLSFDSETQFLAFMSQNNYELVSVVSMPGQRELTTKMYFKIRLER